MNQKLIKSLVALSEAMHTSYRDAKDAGAESIAFEIKSLGFEVAHLLAKAAIASPDPRTTNTTEQVS